MAIFALNTATGVGAAIRVDGDDLIPDATGYYYAFGSWNGWRFYRRHDDAYNLWRSYTNTHVLTSHLDSLEPGYWESPGEGPIGEYTPGGIYAGTPTVVNMHADDVFFMRRKRRVHSAEVWQKRQKRRRLKVPRPRHVTVMNALAQAAREWFGQTPATKLLWSGIAARILTARNGLQSLMTGFERWMQVQMPLIAAGHPMESSTRQRFAYDIRDVRVSWVDVIEQKVLLVWDWKRNSTETERVVLHVSQVPRGLVGYRDLWSYAIMIASYDYPVKEAEPDWVFSGCLTPLLYRVKPGDVIQLYVRFEQMHNPDPPISLIGSRMTTEDWTLLKFTCTEE